MLTINKINKKIKIIKCWCAVDVLLLPQFVCATNTKKNPLESLVKYRLLSEPEIGNLIQQQEQGEPQQDEQNQQEQQETTAQSDDINNINNHQCNNTNNSFNVDHNNTNGSSNNSTNNLAMEATAKSNGQSNYVKA